jgi:hypothetical protein
VELQAVKAKDYAKRFEEQGRTDAALGQVVKDMLDEMIALKKVRHVSTDQGMAAIVRELEQRYNAFARLVGLPEGGLQRFMQSKFGWMYAELMRRD